ncbi:MAG: transporter [Betaproteobacteria bacterium]|nr:MAG: transporter [Betaproteobacteria bacterium]
MKRDRFHRRQLVTAMAAALMSVAANQALGAAFALQEQNASGLGHAYAGGAAAAEDVSTIFYNPAGLVRLASMQIVVAGNLICPSAKFSNSASLPARFQTLGGTGGDAGSCDVVPNLYIGIPFTDKWSFGLGVNVPFGLKTEYDSSWLGRFQAIESKLETININPVLSWEPTKELTVGGGVSWQRVKATLTNNVNWSALFAGGQTGTGGVAGLVLNGTITPAAGAALIGSAAGLESGANVTGNDSAWGWNVGVLWQATPQTRIGAAYRSNIKYTVSGSVNFSNPSPSQLGPLPAQLQPIGVLVANGVNAALSNGDVTLDVKMPETANVSIFHQFDNKWDLMADLQYTGWSSIQQLQVVRSTGVVLSTTPENFRNTWRVSAGANYRYSDNWTLRGGVAFDQSPVNDTDRTPRLPDNDRTWLAIGAQYKISPAWAVDLAYAYIWVKNSSINQNQGNTDAYGLINGSYKNNVNIVGLQVTYTAK